MISFDVNGNQLLVAADGTSHKVNGVIFHTLDTVAGASGSPIVQNGAVVGIHLGYFPRGEKNIAGGGSCAANYAAVTAACTVSVATVGEMAARCIKGGC
jgi:V8-like Glu-specific endopeptidase